jgi:hypothetical protein
LRPRRGLVVDPFKLDVIERPSLYSSSPFFGNIFPIPIPFSPPFYSVPSGGRPPHRPVDNHVAECAGRLCRPVRPPAPPSPTQDSAGGDEEGWKLHGGAHLWPFHAHLWSFQPPTTEQYTHGAKLVPSSSKTFLKNSVKIFRVHLSSRLLLLLRKFSLRYTDFFLKGQYDENLIIYIFSF